MQKSEARRPKSETLAPDFKFIVAHYDHGVRSDSQLDRQLVQGVARQHGLTFVYDEGKLGPGTSEAVARKARYAFLRKVQQTTGARAIITAHHEDDLLETALLNLLRGTGRRGVTSLRSRHDIHRPL
jgi:tRNA(Ile)-lysidine synthase TilS/MesJ